MKKNDSTAGTTPINSVHTSLEGAKGRAKDHPLLQRFREGALTLPEFGFVMKGRLDAATQFVPFLRAIEEKTKNEPGWENMAQELKSNLDEELGINDGKKDRAQDHDTWRMNFRSGLRRVLQNRGMSLDAIDSDQTIRDISTRYGEALLKMSQDASVPALAGAFTVLEGILKQEFDAILCYIKANLDEFTAEELLYITHHAGHEGGHYQAVKTPLVERCVQSPEIIDDVVDGIQRMAQLRLEEVLGQIERNLWKTEQLQKPSTTTL